MSGTSFLPSGPYMGQSSLGLYPAEASFVNGGKQQLFYELQPRRENNVTLLQANMPRGAISMDAAQFVNLQQQAFHQGQLAPQQQVQLARPQMVQVRPQQVQQMMPVQYGQLAQGQQLVQVDLSNGGRFIQQQQQLGMAGVNQPLQLRAVTGMEGRHLVPVQAAGQLQTVQLPGGLAVRQMLPIRPSIQPVNTMVRPLMRIPKMSTVQTYNPATGVRTAASGNSAGNVLMPGVQQISVQQLGGGPAVAMAPNGQARTPAMFAQQQLLANLRAQLAGNALNNQARPAAVMLQGAGQVQQGHQQVFLDSHASHMLDSQSRNTVMKVAVTQQQQQQQIPMQGQGSMLPSYMQIPMQGNPVGTMGQVRQASAPASSAIFAMLADAAGNQVDGNGMHALRQNGVMGYDSQPSNKHVHSSDDGGRSLVPDSSSSNPEDFKALLVCIGTELARHGITISAAIEAGWLGNLSPTDAVKISEAHAEEGRRLAQQAPGASVLPLASYSDGAGMTGQLPAAGDRADEYVDDADMAAQFSAFNFGFFGDAGGGNELLESLENGSPQALNMLGVAQGTSSSWGSDHAVIKIKEVQQDPRSTLMGPASTTSSGHLSAGLGHAGPSSSLNRDMLLSSNSSTNDDFRQGYDFNGAATAPGGGGNVPGAALAARFAKLDLGIGFV